jgi:hypothetical protein
MDDEDDVSGSDADVSGESSDTSSNKDEDDTVDKMFIKWLAPGGSADQAGLMKGIYLWCFNVVGRVVGRSVNQLVSWLVVSKSSFDSDIILDRKSTVNLGPIVKRGLALTLG